MEWEEVGTSMMYVSLIGKGKSQHIDIGRAAKQVVLYIVAFLISS